MKQQNSGAFHWSREVKVSLPDFHSGCPSSILGGTTDENKKRSADERRGFCFLLSVTRDVRLPPAPKRHVVLARRGALLPQFCFRLFRRSSIGESATLIQWML